MKGFVEPWTGTYWLSSLFEAIAIVIVVVVVDNNTLVQLEQIAEHWCFVVVVVSVVDIDTFGGIVGIDEPLRRDSERSCCYCCCYCC